MSSNPKMATYDQHSKIYKHCPQSDTLCSLSAYEPVAVNSAVATNNIGKTLLIRLSAITWFNFCWNQNALEQNRFQLFASQNLMCNWSIGRSIIDILWNKSFEMWTLSESLNLRASHEWMDCSVQRDQGYEYTLNMCQTHIAATSKAKFDWDLQRAPIS